MKPLYWLLGVAGVGTVVALIFGLKDQLGGAVMQLPQGMGGRTPQDILDAVAEVDPEGNATLQHGYLGQANWCNRAAALFARALGVPILYGDYGTRANDMIAWLDAGNDGWYPVVNAGDAQRLAMQGEVVLATYYNLAPGESGHMALVLPLPGTPMIAQAGKWNFNRGTIANGFGAIRPIFYAHS
jgi:hypothetical protein